MRSLRDVGRVEALIAGADAKLIPGDEFPLASRVGLAAGESYGLPDPDASFESGLELLLDGIDQRIALERKKPH